MNTPTRLGVFAAGLVTAFGAAVAVGNAVGPIGSTGDVAQHGAGHDGGDTEEARATTPRTGPAVTRPPRRSLED